MASKEELEQILVDQAYQSYESNVATIDANELDNGDDTPEVNILDEKEKELEMFNKRDVEWHARRKSLSYYRAIVFMCMVCGFVLSMVIIPCFVLSKILNNIFAPVINISLYLTMTIASFALLCKRRSRHKNKELPVRLVVYVVFALILSIMKFIHPSGSNAVTIVLSHITTGMLIISLVVQLLLVWQYRDDGNEYWAEWMNFGFAFIISINIKIVAESMIQPMWAQNVQQHESPADWFKVVTFFLAPFYIEFNSDAVSILYTAWHFENQATSKDITDNTASIVVSNRDQGIKVRGITSRVFLPYWHWVIATFAALGFLLTTTIIAMEHPNLDEYLRVYIYRFVAIVYHLSCLCIASFSIGQHIITKSSQEVTIDSSSLSVTEHLLIFTACSEFIFFFLRVTADFGYLTEEIDSDIGMVILSLSDNLISLIEICVQTFVLLVQHRLNFNRNNMDKFALVYISIGNLASWLLISIIVGFSTLDTYEMAPVEECFYGTRGNKLITLIFMPLLSLYRMNSAVMAFSQRHEIAIRDMYSAWLGEINSESI